MTYEEPDCISPKRRKQMNADFQAQQFRQAVHAFAHRTGCPPGGDVVEWLNHYPVTSPAAKD